MAWAAVFGYGWDTIHAHNICGHLRLRMIKFKSYQFLSYLTMKILTATNRHTRQWASFLWNSKAASIYSPKIGAGHQSLVRYNWKQNEKRNVPWYDLLHKTFYNNFLGLLLLILLVVYWYKIFPRKFKKASRIEKKRGDKKGLKDSDLPTLSKVCEAIVHDRLLCHCQDFNYCIPQHGHVVTGDLKFVTNPKLRK